MTTQSLQKLFHPPPPPPTPLNRYRILSPTAPLRVSPLHLGTMSLGTAWSDSFGPMSKPLAFQLLDAYFDAGGNFFDTSNGYQDEQSELWLGEWMESRGVRDQCVVATKFSADFRLHVPGHKGRGPNFGGNSRAAMRLSLRESLKKLRTDWVDILYVHWWDYTCSPEEMIDSLHMLVEQGRVHYLGISNTPAWVVSAANTYARAHAKTPFSIYQGHWSVLVRDMEREILPMARHFNMAVSPYGAAGLGKFKTRAQIEARRRTGEDAFRHSSDQTEAEVRVSRALEDVSRELPGTPGITAVALAYVMAKAPYVFPSVGGRKVEHLMENIAACEIRLSPEQIAHLEGASTFEPGWPHDIIGRDPADAGVTLPSGAASAHVDFVLRSRPIGYENVSPKTGIEEK